MTERCAALEAQVEQLEKRVAQLEAIFRNIPDLLGQLVGHGVSVRIYSEGQTFQVRDLAADLIRQLKERG